MKLGNLIVASEPASVHPPRLSVIHPGASPTPGLKPNNLRESAGRLYGTGNRGVDFASHRPIIATHETAPTRTPTFELRRRFTMIARLLTVALLAGVGGAWAAP